jgi:predicted PurR-regulated permease PerM
MLPPFVLAGLLAYIITPAIDRASTHSGLPRVLFVLRTFSLFVLFAMLIGYLGLPPLAREMTRVFKPLQARILQLCASRDNVRKSTKLSPQLAVFRWGARTATWKPASKTFTAGTSDNSRGWKRCSRHWMIACGFAMA